MKPKLVSPIIARGLSFLLRLNEQGSRPSPRVVNEFCKTTTSRNIYELDDDFGVTDQDRTVTDYLTRVGFAEQGLGTISLTATGMAFARALEQPDGKVGDESALIEVIGRLEDPFTYAALLTQVDSREHALVVDPFLPAPELSSLLRLPRVERVLTRRTHLSGKRKQDADTRNTHLQIALGANPSVELRLLPNEVRELHDRLVLPASGPGLVIGTSLGGSHLTVITSLGEDTTRELRTYYDSLWDQAVPLEPITRKLEAEPESGSDAPSDPVAP